MIPFTSIAEAEGALGRSLTSWEELWFTLTHNVSDYKLYCMNIVFLFIIFSFVPLPYVLLDVWKVRCAEKWKVQAGVHNEPAETWRCYKTVMWTFFTVVGPLQLCSFGAVRGDPVRAAPAGSLGGGVAAAGVHHGGGLRELLAAPVAAQRVVV
jgi:4,4-dimethyl-9beta,19-cyclopropylsterol-4alpha-methyl oxidase